jgi:hypothetical protein
VLDGPGDADGDIEVRRDGLARLSDLVLMADPAGVEASGPLSPRPPETTMSASVTSISPLSSLMTSTTRPLAAASGTATAIFTISPWIGGTSATGKMFGRRVATSGED